VVVVVVVVVRSQRRIFYEFRKSLSVSKFHRGLENFPAMERATKIAVAIANQLFEAESGANNISGKPAFSFSSSFSYVGCRIQINTSPTTVQQSLTYFTSLSLRIGKARLSA